MKIEKAIDAMRYLLMTYENDRKHIHNEINSYVNTSEHFTLEKLIEVIDSRVTEDAMIERKSVILNGFIAQIVAQMNAMNTPSESSSTEEA